MLESWLASRARWRAAIKQDTVSRFRIPNFRFCSMLDCRLVGMVDCSLRWRREESFFLAKLIVTVHVVGTFPRNVRGGEVGTAPRAVRDLDAADCGRVVDASLPDAVATGLCARERRPWNENRHHGIYSEAYTEGPNPFVPMEVKNEIQRPCNSSLHLWRGFDLLWMYV